MKRSRKQLLYACLLGTSAALAGSARAENPIVLPAPAPAAERVNAANTLVRQGEIDEAIQQYPQVDAPGAERDAVNYNLAVAQYRKGELDAAQGLFAEAARSTDTTLAVISRYNLGNCYYGQALQRAEQDKNAAIALLRQAIETYRSSLRLDPDNADARTNIELAGELIRKLRDQQQQDQQQDQQQSQQQQQQNQKQDQQQQQQNQQQDSQGGQSQDSPRQDQQQGQDQQQQDQQQQGSQGSESDPQQQDDSGSEQGQPDSDQPRDAQGQQQDKPSPAEGEGSEDQSESSDQGQQQDPQRGNTQPQQQPQRRPDQLADQKGDPQTQEATGAEEKPVPSGRLTAADEQASGDAKAEGNVAVAGEQEEGRMSKEEALKMLQAVRDRDMLRRLRQQQIERSRQVPVDRDW